LFAHKNSVEYDLLFIINFWIPDIGKAHFSMGKGCKMITKNGGVLGFYTASL
jgi:hypothetical protein